MNDPYTDTETCVNRLLTEYNQHKKLIVACDYDDTIYDYHRKGYQYPRVIAVLKRCAALGFFIVPFTGSPPDKYESIYTHFAALGIKVSPINTNPFPMPFGNNGKMYFNILLDDRAGLGQSLDVLEQVLDHIEASR